MPFIQVQKDNQKYITISGARMHNLKNIDVSIPKRKLIVITGVSGSGKSSLAFDTLFAEGQRRYIESLSSYARQFLGKLQKPPLGQLALPYFKRKSGQHGSKLASKIEGKSKKNRCKNRSKK